MLNESSCMLCVLTQYVIWLILYTIIISYNVTVHATARRIPRRHAAHTYTHMTYSIYVGIPQFNIIIYYYIQRDDLLRRVTNASWNVE